MRRFLMRHMGTGGMLLGLIFGGFILPEAAVALNDKRSVSHKNCHLFRASGRGC